MRKTFVYCKRNSKGMHDFYMNVHGESYYLFSQNYRYGVECYFSAGVSLDRAWDFSVAKHDTAVLRTMEKLPSYIRYVESLYGIEVLRKTVKKNARQHKRAA